MYDVLVVDDEVHIVEGITKMVDWERCGTKCKDQAYHGQMALEMIESERPRIVITDIKMPGLNGLELIEKTYYFFPEVQFIVLSGHDDFAYAKQAMKYGVKHYLLKPCNEQKIEEALRQVVMDLQEKEKVQEYIDQITPKAKEQQVRELLLNSASFDHGLLKTASRNEKFRIICSEILSKDAHTERRKLKQLMDKQFADSTSFYASAIVSGKVIVVISDCPEQHLQGVIRTSNKEWEVQVESAVISVISQVSRIERLAIEYNKVLEAFSYRFYMNSKSRVILYHELTSAAVTKFDQQQVIWEYENMIEVVRAMDINNVKRAMHKFFHVLSTSKFSDRFILMKCKSLLWSVSFRSSHDEKEELLTTINGIDAIERDVMKVEEYMMEHVMKVVRENSLTKNHLVREIIAYTEQHLQDQSLSLLRVAKEVFFMNPDYLGKVFKREMGMNYTNYLMERRMEMAMEYMNTDRKVFEVAEEVGFGNNPRYFSQIFKRYTGSTPTEYKKEERV
ncbi:response regulator [Geomicrobium sp. JSM 1781026]|uniref:response regulator transcription factor n=1 Tax=Geomicrobium sp. JSM 1781026 TaxID=3344580 RepID=UPI0035C1C4B2